MKRTSDFKGERLVQAREARKMTATNLADVLGVSLSTVSAYEHERQKPPMDIVEKLSIILNVPQQFFYYKIPELNIKGLFFRSMSSATKSARVRGMRRYEWMQEIVVYLKEFFDFPILNIPEFDVPLEFNRIDCSHIEEAARALRKLWDVKTGPCPNLVRLSESKGILISRWKLDAPGLDAFSQWSKGGRPFVVLGSDKAAAVRSRFDLAHEIGHLVLHRHVNESSVSSARDNKIIEQQANRFASAFLLPAKEFATDLYAPTLDAFRMLKQKWKSSIGAMIVRSLDLNIIDEEQSRRLWINMNRRGWRTHEPLDDAIEIEYPSLISQCIKMMVNEKFKTKEQILNDLSLSENDIEELCGLERGYFSEMPVRVLPQIRYSLQKDPREEDGGDIIPFRSV